MFNSRIVSPGKDATKHYACKKFQPFRFTLSHHFYPNILETSNHRTQRRY